MSDDQLFNSPINERFREAVRSDPNSKPWIDFGEELVRVGLDLLNSIEPPIDGRCLPAAGFFARAHESTQAALILLERGAIGDARSILRTATEAAIAISAFADDPDFGKIMAADAFANGLKLTNILLGSPGLRAGLDANAIAEFEAKRDRLKLLPESECRPVRWATVASKHCPDLYDTLYRILSSDGIHVNVGSLARRFERDASGRLSMMKVGPDSENLVSTLQTACTVFLHSLEPFVRLYPVAGFPEKVDTLIQRFKGMRVTELNW